MHQILGCAVGRQFLVQMDGTGDTDGYRHVERYALVRDRCRHGFDHAGRKVFDPVRHIHVVRNDTEEFVATDAGEHTACRQSALDPLRRGAQDGIARHVSVEVVHLLEVVEVDRDGSQCPLVAAFSLEQDRETVRETAPVEAAGKIVDFCKAARFLFGFAACDQFGVQRLVAVPAQQDQRNVEDQRIGQDDVRSACASGPGLEDIGQGNPCSADEKDHRGKGNAARQQVMRSFRQPHFRFLFSPFPGGFLAQFVPRDTLVRSLFLRGDI